MKPFMSFVLALALVGAVFAPVGAQACAAQHTVQRGENLFRIGLTHGVPWPAIAQANNLTNPNLIFVGQVLCIPDSTAAPAPSATAGATATAAATATTAPTAAAPATPGATPTQFVVPTFTIESVVRGQSVTIRTQNFPANQTFTVLMGPLGSLGVNGTPAGTTQSGAGGTLTATYTIPADLSGASFIAIRLQSPSGYYSYNWFANVTRP